MSIYIYTYIYIYNYHNDYIFNNYSTSSSRTVVRGAPSWLSTHYDKSEWNNCFIIYKSLINFFSIVEYHLFRQITKQSASESAVMFQFVKQTPEFICMNGFNVCFKFIIT